MNPESNKFAIGIATYNRADLFNPALAKYANNDFPSTSIFVFDNGRQKFTQPATQFIDFTVSEKNIGVAAAWNVLLEKIFENHRHALILNDDIYLGRKKHDIEALISSNPQSMIVSPTDWCAFILPRSIWDKVGYFDDQFFAYFEDNDYHQRMKLAACGFMKSPVLIPNIYNASMTIEAAENEFRGVFQESRRKYIEKWGGVPGQEKYKVPYNKSRK